MFSLLVVFIALIAAFLILVVLLQSGQGSGLAGIASGGATRQVLGQRQAPDILEKATWSLGTIFIVLCILSNFFITKPGQQESVIQQQAQQQTEQQQQMPPPQNQQSPLGGQQGGSGGGQSGAPGGGN
jgi:preprotein translocase subunit SecG